MNFSSPARIVLLIPSLISKSLCHVASFACLQISARHRKTDLSNPLLTSLRIHFRLYVQFEGFFCYSGVCWGFQGRFDCVLSTLFSTKKILNKC